MNTEELRKLLFICPQCGSNYFGTLNYVNYPDIAIGVCHGSKYSPVYCNFSWNRNNMDEENLYINSLSMQERFYVHHKNIFET